MNVVQMYGKRVYGNLLLYPANEVAREFAALLGVRSFNKAQLEGMKRLGFAIERVEEPELAAVLADIKRDAARNADAAWNKHKAPMAAYWKAVSVYSGHISRAMRAKEASR